MFPVPMTPTVLPCKSKPEVPLMKVLFSHDYMLYAFYDLKSISCHGVLSDIGDGRNDLLYLLLGSYNINIIKACTAKYNFHHFLPVLMTSASTTSLTNAMHLLH
jgi:hypothetical protein